MFDTIRLTMDGRGVATLELHRPDKHNALNAAMIGELTAAAESLAANSAVRVVVLSAAGTSFCAGGDLTWMRDQMQADPQSRASGARRFAGMLGALNDLPKPLIGRVHGQAFGGGLGLISVCDVAIGVPSAHYGLTETRLGLIPATIGPYVVARIGEAMARRIAFSSRRFDAAEAERLGLIARTVEPEALDAEIEAEVAPYLACAPQAVAAAKAQIRSLGLPLGPDVIEASIAALIARWESAEAAEGIAAFLERRPPSWSV